MPHKQVRRQKMGRGVGVEIRHTLRHCSMKREDRPLYERIMVSNCIRFCQLSRRKASQLEAIGLSRSSGRKKVQSNRGLAHVPPASHGGRNMLAHSGPTAEKVSQFFMAAAVARC